MIRLGDYRVLVEPPTPGFPVGSGRVIHSPEISQRAVIVADNFNDHENLRCARAWLELHREIA